VVENKSPEVGGREGGRERHGTKRRRMSCEKTMGVLTEWKVPMAVASATVGMSHAQL